MSSQETWFARTRVGPPPRRRPALDDPHAEQGEEEAVENDRQPFPKAPAEANGEDLQRGEDEIGEGEDEEPQAGRDPVHSSSPSDGEFSGTA